MTKRQTIDGISVRWEIIELSRTIKPALNQLNAENVSVCAKDKLFRFWAHCQCEGFLRQFWNTATHAQAVSPDLSNLALQGRGCSTFRRTLGSPCWSCFAIVEGMHSNEWVEWPSSLWKWRLGRWLIGQEYSQGRPFCTQLCGTNRYTAVKLDRIQLSDDLLSRWGTGDGGNDVERYGYFIWSTERDNTEGQGANCAEKSSLAWERHYAKSNGLGTLQKEMLL